MNNLLSESILLMKEMGKDKNPISFDDVVCSVLGLDEIDNNIDTTEYEDNLIMLLDDIGLNEVTINEFIGSSDKVSQLTGRTIAYNISQQYQDEDIYNIVDDYLNNINFDEIDTISHKSGYKRTLVVKNGNKVWVNKRNPNKKVHRTAKQRMALAKIRLKAHTGQAKAKRKKSMKLRKISFGNK